MRISTPSTNSVLAALGLLLATAALAQDSARDKIQDQGDAAMERVKGAVSRERGRRDARCERQYPP